LATVDRATTADVDQAPTTRVPTEVVADGPASPRHRRIALAGCATSVVLPLLAALIKLAQDRWYPMLDFAQIELLVRDVGGRGTPLVGLPGRIGRGVTLETQGSHPGPISFWAMAPPYRLFGSTPWALQAAAASLNALAMGLALWLTYRRGGVWLTLLMANALAVLTYAYGIDRLTEPWNPYLPLMWWVVFLLSVWSVLCRDVVALPLAVIAGTFCMQTHIPYVGLVGGLGAGAAVVVAWWWLRSRRDPDARRALVRWGVASSVLLVLLWVPPVIDQIRNTPGNLSIIRDTFANPTDSAVGLGGALEPWLAHLNVWALLSSQSGIHGSPFPGIALLIIWLACALAAWRWWHIPLMYLNAVACGALILGLVSISRILGVLLDYLLMWAWATTAILLVSIVWTAALGIRAWLDNRDPGALRHLPAVGTGALALTLVVVTGFRTQDAVTTDPPTAGQSRVFDELVEPTVGTLVEGEIAGTGPDGRYIVAGVDPLTPPGNARGLLLELARQGLDVAADRNAPQGFPRHRTIPQEDATATIVVVVGRSAIDEWRADPDAIEIAYAAPRPADEAAVRTLRGTVRQDLERAGVTDLLPLVDRNLLALLVERDTPPAARAELMDQLLRPSDIALPTAIFVAPPAPDPGQ
jgi:hypothetical protein